MGQHFIYNLQKINNSSSRRHKVWGNLFFFSSRRRHTRSLRDWSSDVCSSDLSFGARVVAAVEDCAPSEFRERLRDEARTRTRSEEHTSELQSRRDLVCRLLLEKKK